MCICEKITEAINTAAGEFLAKISTAAKELLFDEFDKIKEERGLYVDWYDEEKVETTIRLFPRVLSETVHIGSPDGGSDCCVSHNVVTIMEDDGSFNLKAISLIPLLVELTSEFGQSEE